MGLTDRDYERLLALRTGLRHFERWSAQQAEAAGLTPSQHQLMLAIRGHANGPGPTIGEVADYLLLRHHSAVGLVDRAEAAGLVQRTRSDDDRRVVRLGLTEEGAERLAALSRSHLEELDRLALEIPAAWEGLAPVQRPHGFPERAPTTVESTKESRTVGIARVFDAPGERVARRVLVDRLWPRGVAKSTAPFDEWAKDVAPSSELRRWYAHLPDRYPDFVRRYLNELAEGPAREALAVLRAQARERELVLVTAARDLERSGAAALRDVLLD